MVSLKHWFVPPAPLQGEFRIHGIGVRELMPACVINRPSGTVDYLFMYFSDPVAVEQSGIVSMVLPQSFRVWGPGVRQYYGNDGGPWNHSWIHCDGLLVPELVRHAQIPVDRAVRVRDTSIVERSLEDLHDELTTQSPLDPVIARNLFQNMLQRVARSLEGDGHGRFSKQIPESFVAIKKYMEAHFAEPLTLKHLAGRAHLSIPHFCSEFRKYFEVPPVEFLIRIRMHAATYYLRNFNRSVSDVARQVGYEDIFYFSKLFKKRYGLSPRAMRTKILGGSPSGASWTESDRICAEASEI